LSLGRFKLDLLMHVH